MSHQRGKEETLSVRGTSDFTVESSLNPAQVKQALEAAVEDLRHNPAVADVNIHWISETDPKIEILFRGPSFGQADEILSDLARQIENRLQVGSLTPRATELVTS